MHRSSWSRRSSPGVDAVEGLLARAPSAGDLDKPDPPLRSVFRRDAAVRRRAPARCGRDARPWTRPAHWGLTRPHPCGVPRRRQALVLQVAARLTAASARGPSASRVPDGTALESLLLRHAIGDRVDRWTRGPAPAAVMIPIWPRRPAGWRAPTARGRAGIDDVMLTAKTTRRWCRCRKARRIWDSSSRAGAPSGWNRPCVHCARVSR